MKKNIEQSMYPYQAHDPLHQITCKWNPDGPFEGIPELRYFEHAHLREAKPLLKHQHPDAFEFSYVEKGSASWEVNGESYDTRAGELFYIRPAEIHSAGFNILEPCTLWSIIINTPADQGKLLKKRAGSSPKWFQCYEEDTRQLFDGLYRLPRVMSLGSAPLDSLRRVGQAIENRGSFYRLEGKIALLDFLLLLLHSRSNQAKLEADLLEKLKSITEKLAATPGWRPSVPELAALVGISPSYFYRVFQEYTRLTPTAFMERIRIKDACRSLRETDVPITEIALELGYSTSQNFATAFRKLMGMTPTVWRSLKHDHNIYENIR